MQSTVRVLVQLRRFAVISDKLDSAQIWKQYTFAKFAFIC